MFSRKRNRKAKKNNNNKKAQSKAQKQRQQQETHPTSKDKKSSFASTNNIGMSVGVAVGVNERRREPSPASTMLLMSDSFPPAAIHDDVSSFSAQQQEQSAKIEFPFSPTIHPNNNERPRISWSDSTAAINSSSSNHSHSHNRNRRNNNNNVRNFQQSIRQTFNASFHSSLHESMFGGTGVFITEQHQNDYLKEIPEWTLREIIVTVLACIVVLTSIMSIIVQEYLPLIYSIGVWFVGRRVSPKWKYNKRIVEFMKKQSTYVQATVGVVVAIMFKVVSGASPTIHVLAILGILIPPYTVLQEHKLTDCKAMVETKEAMSKEVQKLAYNNKRLDVENQHLAKSVERLQDMKDAYEEYQEMGRIAIEQLETQLADSKAILHQLENDRSDGLTEIIADIMLTADDDGNFMLSDSEVDSLIEHVESVAHVEIEDDGLKEMIDKYGRDMESIMNLFRDLLDDDPNTAPVDHSLISPQISYLKFSQRFLSMKLMPEEVRTGKRLSVMGATSRGNYVAASDSTNSLTGEKREISQNVASSVKHCARSLVLDESDDTDSRREGVHITGSFGEICEISQTVASSGKNSARIVLDESDGMDMDSRLGRVHITGSF